MFCLPPSVRIYFAIELTDMRKGIDGLRAIVEGALRRGPYEGHIFVFAGDVASGKSLAGLYSLVATCETRRINPFDYLVDVLARVQDHPARAIDDLLPGAWAAAE